MNKSSVKLIIPILLCAIAALIYLSGGIFLFSNGMRFTDASFTTIYAYWMNYGDQKAIRDSLINSLSVGFALVFFPLAVWFSPKAKSGFGNAKLATSSDIRKAGLFVDNGIMLGKYRGRYLMFDRGLHVLMTAPTGSGKGVSFVIPNLLSCQDSVVVLDMKFENWDLTSGYRHKHGQECFLFAPGTPDYRTHRCNPLSYISEDPNFRVDDLNKIANMFFPDKEKTDVIWTAGPRSLFLGIALLLIETGSDLTLGNILRMSLNGGDPKEFFEAEIGNLEKEGRPLSMECSLSLMTYTSVKSDNTRSGILAGFRAGLELFMNPLIDAATSANDFDLRDVRKKRMSIYVGITPSDIERFTPLIRLFFQLLIDLNTRELPTQNRALKIPCLLILDEFAMLKLDVLSKGVSFLRGYGLQLLPILQSPAQLTDIYGINAAKNFMTNHAVSIVFPPKASDTDTAKAISDWLGYMSVKSFSKSRSASLLGKRESSISESDRQRALLMPQEISALPEGVEIVIIEKTAPIIAEMVYFYKEQVFIERLKSVSPMLKKVRGNPSKKDYENAAVADELSAPVPTITINNEVTFAMPKIKDMYVFDWEGIRPPLAGQMDKDALYAYSDSLCIGAGVAVNG